MADKPTLSRAFNTHLLEFFDDIIRIYPDNTDIVKAKKPHSKPLKRQTLPLLLRHGSKRYILLTNLLLMLGIFHSFSIRIIHKTFNLFLMLERLWL